VRCVMLPSGSGTAVELRSEHGGVFLPKLAPSITAARNEAEYLRLLLHRESTPPAASRLLLSRVLPTAASRPPTAPTA
jgi:hypothetical protein